MEAITKDLSDFLVKEVKKHKPEYTDVQAIAVASEIIQTNFPKCLEKWAKGEKWIL